MDVSKKVAVVIPFYKDTLSAYELIALQQCDSILAAYPKIAIKPDRLKMSDIGHKMAFNQIVSFDNSFFTNIAGYNKLMLSKQFYQCFLDYEYILIYQLDAFVFSDQLSYWCEQGHDYIGAPWIRPVDYTDLFKEVKSRFQYFYHTRFNILKDGVPSEKQFENKVGNGGFSLRRVRKFFDLTISMGDLIRHYLQHEGVHEYNEDVFWSVEVNRRKKILSIPDYKIAIKFAFELAPERAYRLNHYQLPFGCHAWDLNLEYWRPVFKKYHYHI